MGQAQQYNVALKNMDQTYGREMMEQENVYATDTLNTQLNAQDSGATRDQYIADIQQFAGSTDPNDQAMVKQILADAQASGLRPYHLSAVRSAAKGIKSSRAGMDYQAANEALFQGKLTTEQMQLQNDLSRQEIRIGNQTFQLGELQIENERWLAQRRATEATLSDTAAVQNLLGTAYAQGDTGFINERIAILERGDEASPQYQALVAAGVTVEGLESKLTTMREDERFRLRERGLQDALIEEEYGNIVFRGETNKSTLLDTLAKRYTPAELEQKMADSNDPLGRMVETGVLADTDMRAVSRQALLYRDLENEELLAPKVERAWKKLEVYASVPADRAVAENGLRSTLSGLVQAGVMSENEAEGVVTTYRESWDYQGQVQSEELAASVANRTYQQAQATALVAEVEALNAESSPIANGMTEEQGRYYQTARGTITDTINSLMSEAELGGCGFSPDGLGIDPSGGEACANYAVQVRQERNKLVDLGNTLTLGSVDAATRVRELADREAAGNATPQERQEFLTYEQAMGEDTIAEILGVPAPGRQNAQPTEGAQQAAGEQPKQGGGFFNSIWNLGPGGAVTRLQEQLSAPTGQQPAATTGFRGPWSNQQPVRGATPQQTPATAPQQSTDPTAVGSTTGSGTAAKLNAIPEFAQLVGGIADGTLNTRAQLAAAEALGAANGLTTTAVLELAQQQAFAANPPGYRTPWSGQ
jgi:hypothetical protein